MLRQWKNGAIQAKQEEIAQYVMQRHFRRMIIAYN